MCIHTHYNERRYANMTQFQFDTICNIIRSGAPALANELCSSLNDLVVDRNQLAQQVEDLQLQLAEPEASKESVSEQEVSK